MTQNRALQEAVLAALWRDPSVNAAHIGIAADAGVVTLYGHVENFAEKQCAEEAAARVGAVKAVVEELAVKLPLPLEYGDEEIARAALNRFDRENSPSFDTIKVRVESGWVTLSGQVEYQGQREAAERVLLGVSGIVGIENETTVVPHASRTTIEGDNLAT